MDTSAIFTTWLPLLVAGLIQVSFGLGVSMLTLLSGHLLSQADSTRRLGRLSLGYILGALATTAVLLLSLVFIFSNFSLNNTTWLILSSASAVVGVGVLMFYYRKGKSGTRLWLPRRAAEYLYQRTKATRRTFEAFILGAGAVVAELVFIAVPLIIAAAMAAELTGLAQTLAILLYLIIAILPLVILFISNTGGRKVSAFQRWREQNKRFLQFTAGALLIVLGLYLTIFQTAGGGK